MNQSVTNDHDLPDTNVLSVENLRVHFQIPIRKGLFNTLKPLKAVDDVSFQIKAGETLGIVGESGCGKSTLGRGIVKLLEITEGKVYWKGENIAQFDKSETKKLRREVQMIFQDPLASLNPRMTIGEIIAEPLLAHYRHLKKSERDDKVKKIMSQVGLMPQMINRYPHEFSGGQCQRIGIARAMVLEPELIVCDEPVSALDVSIQAQIINLLEALQNQFGLSLIFIGHDLSVVRHISDRILVLYLGNMVELADSRTLFKNPLHPYTQALISAVPIANPEKERNKKRLLLTGDLPSPMDPPSGCVFRTRCPKAQQKCSSQTPNPEVTDNGQVVACHFWREAT